MKQRIISVIGLGFVGLPTACILANCKDKKLKNTFKVNGIDRNLNKIKKDIFNFNFKSKIIYEDKNLNKIIKNVVSNNKINFSDKIQEVFKSDVIIISINFDFNKKNSPKKFNELKNFFQRLGRIVKKNSLILIETTLPPGTCDNVIIPILKETLKKRRMKLEDICLSYSYERVMPGKEYMNSIVNNHRCYAGMNKASSLKCRNFLKKYINYKKFPLYEFDNLIDCEAAKILENSYRAVNIAFIDEWTKFSVKTKLNLNKIIDAIKYRSTHNNIMRPGLGVGGYCLTKDPDFINLSGKYLFKKKFSFPITNISMKINKKMIFSTVEFIKDKIRNFKKKKILLLGAAYKDDVSDTRSSPSIFFSNFLKKNNINFFFHDPITNANDNKKYSISSKLPNFKKFDLVLFCVKHSYYKNMSIKKFSKKPTYFDLNRVLSYSQIKHMIKNKFKLEFLGGR